MFGSRKGGEELKARMYVLWVSATVVTLAILSLVFMVAAAFGKDKGLADGPFP